jgi:hypothetical protein
MGVTPFTATPRHEVSAYRGVTYEIIWNTECKCYDWIVHITRRVTFRRIGSANTYKSAIASAREVIDAEKKAD